MNKKFGSILLPLSLVISAWVAYYILRCFDIPIWIYRGYTALTLAIPISFIIGVIWLMFDHMIRTMDDDSKENDTGLKHKEKVYGSD